MPEPPESDEVEHDVKIELASVVKRDLNDAKRSFRIVGIDVKYRCLRDMGGIGRIDRTAAKPRRRRKSDLIINDKMYRAACPIARQPGELERFHYYALSGKCGVTMKQKRQHLIVNFFTRAVLALAKCILTCPCHSFDDRIYGLEVTRVTRQSDLEVAAGFGLSEPDGALMIFNIALIGREIRM